jgi:uncharacterized protein YbaR (Trm112 family)
MPMRRWSRGAGSAKPTPRASTCTPTWPPRDGKGREAPLDSGGRGPRDDEQSPGRSRSQPRPHTPWAELLRRTFEIDVLACPECGGRLRLLATIEQPAVVRKILSHLGIPAECPEPLPARSPTGSPDLFDSRLDKGAPGARPRCCIGSAGARAAVGGARLALAPATPRYAAEICLIPAGTVARSAHLLSRCCSARPTLRAPRRSGP